MAKYTTTNNVTGYYRARKNKQGQITHYDVYVSEGDKNDKGKLIYARFRAESEDEAENTLTIKKAEALQGKMTKPNDITVGEFLDDFYITFTLGTEKSPATCRDYKGNIEGYLKPAFGEIELQKLTTMDIQRKINSWRKCSPKSNKPLAPASIQNIYRTLNAALNKAVVLGLISKSPTEGVELPPIKTEIKVYTIGEVKQIQSAAKGTDMELPIALLLDCAMRVSELIGLRWCDIDFDKDTVHIRQNIIHGVDGKLAISNCKTENSQRDIVITQYTMKLLKKQLILYKEAMLKYGKKYNGKDYVIFHDDGKFYHPDSLSSKWRKFLKKNNIRREKLHVMRHTSVSLMVLDGMPLSLIQERAGHKNPEVTLGVYAHTTKDTEKMIAKYFQSKVFPDPSTVEIESSLKLVK